MFLYFRLKAEKSTTHNIVKHKKMASPITPISLVSIILVLSLTKIYGQYPVPGVNQCVYSFTINQAQIDSVCGTRTGNLGPDGLSEEVRVELERIKLENTELKEEIEKLREDYEAMVAGVLKIEQETAGWKEVISWPNVEPSLKPNNETIITLKDPAFPGGLFFLFFIIWHGILCITSVNILFIIHSLFSSLLNRYNTTVVQQ